MMHALCSTTPLPNTDFIRWIIHLPIYDNYQTAKGGTNSLLDNNSPHPRGQSNFPFPTLIHGRFNQCTTLRIGLQENHHLF